MHIHAVEKKRVIWTIKNSQNRVRIIVEIEQLKAASRISVLVCRLYQVSQRESNNYCIHLQFQVRITWLNMWSDYVMPLHNILFIVFVQNFLHESRVGHNSISVICSSEANAHSFGTVGIEATMILREKWRNGIQDFKMPRI